MRIFETGIRIAHSLAVFVPLTMNWLLSSSIQLVISDLNEIAADAYRYRIRPANKKGGSGVYDGSNGGRPYAIPEKFLSNRRAQFAITSVLADSIEIVAVSPDDRSCCVRAMIDRRGRLGEIHCPSTVRHETPSSPAIVSHTSAGDVSLPFNTFPKVFDEAG